MESEYAIACSFALVHRASREPETRWFLTENPSFWVHAMLGMALIMSLALWDACQTLAFLHPTIKSRPRMKDLGI